MKTTSYLGLAVAAVCALGLSACGGGGGGNDSASTSTPTATDSVPVSALASTDSFVQYQQQLQPSNTIEPLSLQQLLPPLSDTTEPTPIS